METLEKEGRWQRFIPAFLFQSVYAASTGTGFWPLENRHFVSVLRYLIQFLSLEPRFRVRVSVSFFGTFFFSHVG